MGSFIPRRKRFWRSRARSIYHRLARLIGGRARDDPSGDRHVSPDATHDIGLASKNDDTPIANRVATPSYDGSLIPNSGSTLGNDDPLVSGSCPAPSHDDPPVPNSCSTPSNDHTTIPNIVSRPSPSNDGSPIPNSRPTPSNDHPTIPSIVSCSSPNYDGPPSPTRGSTPRNEDLSTTRSLWDRAYDSLKEENPKLVEDYEKLLSEDTPGTISVSNDDPPALLGDASPATNNRPRKAQLDDIMAKGIQRLEEGKTKYTIAGHEFVLRDQVAGAAKLVLWAKNLVTEGVKASPEASIAWAGVCIILPLLTNPQVAEEANRDGFTHVTARMRYYAGFEPLFQNLSETDGVPDGVKEAIEGDMLRLYQKILEFQIQSVLRFYQSCFTRYVRDVLSTRDWKQMKLDIEGLDREFNKNLSQINEFISTEKLKSLSNTSKEALDTMRQFMSVFEEQLRVEKRQLEIQEDEVRQKLSDKQKACLQLFRLTSSDKDTTYEWYKSRVEDRVEGTCEWFLKHDNFQTWLEQDSGPLLVSADPGCGKSVLAKYLIDHGLPRSPTICYFFFKDQDQNTVRQALCALLHQLFTKRPWLIKHAVEQFDRDGRNLINSTTSLWTVLGEAVQDPEAGPIIMVLDALDECAESEFKQLIQNVKAQFRGGRPKCGRLKYLLTSRPYEQIVSQFRDLLNSFPYVRIPGEEESDTISEEVNRVIKYRVEKLAMEKDLAYEVRNHLEAKLLSIPHRTYLWVYLVFDYLKVEHFKQTQLGVDRTMATLPKTVNEAYEQILSKSKERPTVLKALSIILVATEPLNIAEMNVAMNVDSTTKAMEDLDLEEDTAFESRLRSLCGLFISIHHEKIYFLHQTAREFLLDEFSVEIIPPGTGWQHSITSSSAHMTLAEVCVIFLDLFEVRTNRTIMKGEQSLEMFFRYASWNWVKHFHNARVLDSSSIMAVALRICNTRSQTSLLWWDRAWGQKTRLFSKTPSNLEIAAYLGIDLVARRLLEADADLEAKHCINDTLALVAAITKDHHSTVELLLGSRVNLEAKDERGNTPLLIATRRGKVNQIKPLLDAGADWEAKDKEGRTPLYIAAYGQNEQIVKLLLNAGADWEAKDQEGRMPLHMAASGQKGQIVKLLLDAGADWEAKDQEGRTPLHMAAKLSKQIVKLLLDAGADWKAKDQKGCTPLHIAASGQMKQTVKLLLDAGADLEAKDQEGCTPLHMAASGQNEQIVKLLLDTGADLEAKDQEGRTPLHIAASGQKEQIVKLLFDTGADLEAKDQEGRTPLHMATSEQNEQIVKLLLDIGANLEAKDQEGRTPLYIAALERKEQIVKLLLDAGADWKAKDQGDRMPLYIAALRPDEQIVKRLLETGVDLDPKGGNNNTSLHLAAPSGQEHIVKLLLEGGANRSFKNITDGTPLHQAVKEKNEQMVKLLLESGANLEARNNDGSTPLHLVAGYPYSDGILKLLLEVGADLEAKNTLGETPLCRAVHFGRTDMVKLLLEAGADLEARDNRGDAPLSTAVRWGNTDMVKLLLEAGADPEPRDNYGFGPLHTANFCNEGIIKLLLEAGSDLGATCNSGETPLHTTARYGNTDMVKLLIEAGADLEAMCNAGATPLYQAAQHGRTNTIKLLLEAGANLEFKHNTDDSTPLLVAASFGHTDIVELLLEAGADLEAMCNEGETPLSIAVRFKWREMVELLLEAGAKRESRHGIEGATLLDIARDLGCQEIVTLLQDGARDGSGAASSEEARKPGRSETGWVQ